MKSKSVKSINPFKSVIQTMKAHGGELFLETAINKGTNFTIRLNR